VRLKQPKTLLNLILNFSLGLFIMWSKRCKWHWTVKAAVTFIFAILLICIALPQFQPPDRPEGGIKLVNAKQQADVFGPEAIGNVLGRDVYSVSADSTVIAEGSAADRIMVFCNPDGKYYHAKTCKYVRASTGLMTLRVAMDTGYAKCADCTVVIEGVQ
jgi:cell division protein FtsW (lipid II flippase)